MRTLTALAAISLFTALPQEPPKVMLGNGVQVQITTKSSTGDAGHLKADVTPAAENSVYRIFRDETGLAVYAYEIVVEGLPDGNHFQVIARPAGEEFAAKFPYIDGGKPTPTLPRPIESIPLLSGGRFTVDIPTNPGWFEHRTDTIQIGPARSGFQSVAKLRFVGLRVSINEKAVPIQGPGTMVAGRYVMFYIPGKGGYFFSTLPIETSRLAFVAGTVDGTRLRFAFGDEAYDCNAEAPILLESQSGQVWVYRDSNYSPRGSQNRRGPRPRASGEFFTAASDSMDWWLQ
ncbi:MAG TPA: hypothetical protein VGV35_00565 [Bryobacteraceae bacterium]|nr:hypothetical protein [Bryobacteraceae bacterium]